LSRPCLQNDTDGFTIARSHRRLHVPPERQIRIGTSDTGPLKSAVEAKAEIGGADGI
jgi:hypothetical protein